MMENFNLKEKEDDFMEKNGFTPEQYQELEKYIDSLSEKKNALISVLHKAQEIFGYLPREVQFFVSQKLEVPSSKVYGVITFYSYFNTEPLGKYSINVCMGTACFVRGADKIIKEFEEKLNISIGETTPDGKFSLNSLRCVGACGLSPVISINEKVYGEVLPAQVKKILAEYPE